MRIEILYGGRPEWEELFWHGCTKDRWSLVAFVKKFSGPGHWLRITNKPASEIAPDVGICMVENYITAKKIFIPIETPYCCNPAMERFWSM